MKPPPFRYLRPETLEEALNALAEGDGRVLAGGLSLLPLLKLRLISPEKLVDVSRLSSLNHLEIGKTEIRIGATRTLRDLIGDPGLQAAAPAFSRTLVHVGSGQIRNKATFVGGLCHGDPASQAVLLATIFDSSLMIASVRGSRRVSMANFLHGPLATCAQDDELITEAVIPRPPSGHAYSYRAHTPRPGDYATCAAAILAVAKHDGSLTHITIAISAAQHIPFRLFEAEQALLGSKINDDRANARIMHWANMHIERSGGRMDEEQSLLLSSLVAAATKDVHAQLSMGAEK